MFSGSREISRSAVSPMALAVPGDGAVLPAAPAGGCGALVLADHRVALYIYICIGIYTILII